VEKLTVVNVCGVRATAKSERVRYFSPNRITVAGNLAICERRGAVMFKRFLWVAPAIWVAACASSELNRNTLDIASTTDALLTRQVLHNLSNFIDSDIAIPAQVVISAGSTATTNTISPSVSFPLTNAFTVAETAGHSLVAAGNTFGTMNGLSTAAAGATLSGTDAWSQNLGWSPITDEMILRRLRALYRIAVSQAETKEPNFIKSYPLIPKSISRSRPVCVKNEITGQCAVLQASNQNVVDNRYYDRNGVQRPTPPNAPAQDWPPKNVVFYSVKATSLGPQAPAGGGGGSSSTAGTDTFSDEVPDEYYLKGPGCVVCLKNGQHYVEKFPHNLEVNANLKGNWLHWRALPGATKGDNYFEGDIPLGQYGHYELFVDGNHPDRRPPVKSN
jgi:hypothetical protein